ncbi:GNAT family N-acetyltransferase [Virgibacillus sp. W0430]|uniref:GNAT family N-acetyltransferase n=1 Tax=Virgibacillus sp. W0430 TaxID=3391580 RepID=UPI003F4869D2
MSKGAYIKMISNHLVKYEKMIIRNSTYSDINELVQLSTVGFPGMEPFTAADFKSHLNIFPQGQYCVEHEGKIIGSCTSMIINFDDYLDEDSFDKITFYGSIKNHNPNGHHLYGVDVVVHPRYRNMKVGSKLYEARKNLCTRLNLKSIIFGGRIPGYYRYAQDMTAMDYVQKVLKGIIYDPTLTFQLNQGFTFKKVIPNYLPDDNDSLKYATLMEWVNSTYNK